MVDEIKKLIKEKKEKVVVGVRETVKELKNGNLVKIFMSSNCPDYAREDIEKYAQLSEAEIVVLEITNEELGVILRKPFYVSVVGVRK